MVIGIVTPIPIGLLIGITAFVEIHVLSMVVAFPLAVISCFRRPHMIIVVIRIVNTHMRLAAGVEQRGSQNRCE